MILGWIVQKVQYQPNSRDILVLSVVEIDWEKFLPLFGYCVLARRWKNTLFLVLTELSREEGL